MSRRFIQNGILYEVDTNGVAKRSYASFELGSQSIQRNNQTTQRRMTCQCTTDSASTQKSSCPGEWPAGAVHCECIVYPGFTMWLCDYGDGIYRTPDGTIYQQ